MMERRYARKTSQEVMYDFPIGTKINLGSESHLKYNRIDVVEGYIFDGRYWYPAYDTWDGWIPYYGDADDETYEPYLDPELEWLKDI